MHYTLHLGDSTYPYSESMLSYVKAENVQQTRCFVRYQVVAKYGGLYMIDSEASSPQEASEKDPPISGYPDIWNLRNKRVCSVYVVIGNEDSFDRE